MKRYQWILCLLGIVLSAVKAHAANDIYVVQLILDGMRYDVMMELLKIEELPHLKKYFIEEGSQFENAYTVFPTVSMPAYISFVTGLGPADSGVPFLEWFNRETKQATGYLTFDGYLAMNRDFWNRRALFNPERPELNPPSTIFEHLSEEHTFALYSPFRRGATDAYPKKIPWRALWSAFVTHNGPALDKHAYKKLLKTFSKPTSELPRFTLVGLYSSDYIGHHKGTKVKNFLPVLRQLDKFLGEFATLLQHKGLWDKTALVITSDHGMHEAGKHFDLGKVFWAKNLQVKTDNPKNKNFDLYIANRGVSSTFVYTRGPEGWEELPDVAWLRQFPSQRGPVDLIQLILEQKATDWIAVRDGEGHVRIWTHDGREGLIKISKINGERFYSYQYSAEKGVDPWGFASDPSLRPLLAGTPFSTQVWGEKTYHTERPDAVVQVGDLFEDIRTGDILVVTKPQWTFRSKKTGSHGSLNQADMHIPLLVRGPNMHGTISKKFVRSVDLYPTYLQWFDFPFYAAESMGRSLFATVNDEPTLKLATKKHKLAALEMLASDYPPLSKMIDESELTQALKKLSENQDEFSSFAKQEELYRYNTFQKLSQMKKRENGTFGLEKELLLSRERHRLQRMEDIRKALSR